eukprot:jgi/Psemu1/311723/fgenesh1_kg.819_\
MALKRCSKHILCFAKLPTTLWISPTLLDTIIEKRRDPMLRLETFDFDASEGCVDIF